MPLAGWRRRKQKKRRRLFFFLFFSVAILLTWAAQPPQRSAGARPAACLSYPGSPFWCVHIISIYFTLRLPNPFSPADEASLSLKPRLAESLLESLLASPPWIRAASESKFDQNGARRREEETVVGAERRGAEKMCRKKGQQCPCSENKRESKKRVGEKKEVS